MNRMRLMRLKGSRNKGRMSRVGKVEIKMRERRVGVGWVEEDERVWVEIDERRNIRGG